MVHSRINRLFDFLIYSNVYVALPVTLIAGSTYYLHSSASVDYSLLLLIYFSTLFLYCFHRIYPFEKVVYQPLSKRYAWLENNRTLFLGIMLTALAFTLGLIIMMNQVIWFWLIPLGLISVLYTIPFVRISGHKKRLRDIPYIKIFVIAFTVTCVTAYLPIASSKQEIFLLDEEVILLCTERFFFILCITIPFDIRDLQIDEKMALKTFPLLLGVKNALALALVFLVIFVVVLSYHFTIYEMMSGTIYLAMLSSALITGLIVVKSTSGRSEYYFSFLLEGTMVIQFLLILIASCYLSPN